MRYLSVCSGIEAASVAWESLGWTPVAFAEIEKFPSQVLAHHFPDVPNLGDMTKYKEWNLDRKSIDLIVGGTPCQSFSVAGLRKGLEDPRGNLALTFLGMVDHYRPEWVIWENVPGVLSSSGGRDFGSFLGALGQLGYGFCYRVLDAQYFGVPQRRRRVFVVAHSSGDSRRAAKILFEPESLSRNYNQSKQKGQSIAGGAITGSVSSKWAKGTGGPAGDECYNLVQVMYDHHPNDSRISGPVDASPTVAARWGTGGGNTPIVQNTYRKSRRAQSTEDFETWVPDSITNTLNCFDVGDVRSTDIVVQPTVYSVREDAKANTISAIQSNVANCIQSTHPATTSHHAINYVVHGAIPIQDVRDIEKKQNGIGIGDDGDPSYTIDSMATQGVAHTFKIRGQGHYTGANGGVARPGGGGCGYIGQDEKAYTVATHQDQTLMQDMVVRRLTPIECERLQGFPDNWTDVTYYKCCGITFHTSLGKYGCPNCEGRKEATTMIAADGPRYKAIGNSMAVPVMRWIGERINEHR